MSTDEQQASEHRAGVLTEVSAVMERLYTDKFGRAPSTTKTVWCGDEALAVFLESTLTQAERTLADMDEHQRLRSLRADFQYAMVRELCEPVEAITGRKVRSFLSSMDTEEDGLASEVFVLHPEGYEGPSRIERADR